MKKLSILCIAILLAIGTFGQEPAKKTTISIRSGLGTVLLWPTELYVELGMEADHRFNKHFSMYAQASLNYVASFYTAEYNYNIYVLMAGPRYYPGKNFFLGIGSGILSTPIGPQRLVMFNVNPHIGFDSRRMQVLIGHTIGFDNTKSAGFTTLTLSFKLNPRKK